MQRTNNGETIPLFASKIIVNKANVLQTLVYVSWDLNRPPQKLTRRLRWHHRTSCKHQNNMKQNEMQKTQQKRSKQN